VLKEALDWGHTVKAIVRHPEKLEARERRVAKVDDVYDAGSLAKPIQGNDDLISAFKPGWKNPSLYADEGRGTVSIIAAVKQAGIKRVLWVGGAGGLESSAWATISFWVNAAGPSAISVQDYAVAMIDELERPAHVRQRFTVGY
jgi:putative NADH-flavin reductase